jgi:TorA maturation chaperone TorD
MDLNSQEHNILKGYNMLIYFAGTMIMYEPSEECIIDFWKNGIIKNLPVSSSNPHFIKAASQLRESCADKSACSKHLIEDYTRLFGSENMALAPAFESIYSEKTTSVSGINGTSVTEFYADYGWQSKFKGKIQDDHLGIELLFLTLLIDKYIVLDDEACRIEMRNEIRRFINLHILSWINKWNEKIQVYASTLCFKGIGSLVVACIEDIYSMMTSMEPHSN